MSAQTAALLPVALVAVAFEVFCLIDIFKADEVRHLPRWVWAIISLLSIPLGGIAYLIIGKAR